MRYDDIKAEYAKDTIDPNSADLDSVSLSIPRLHQKYLDILSVEKSHLVTLQHEFDKVSRLKWEYYSGKMSESSLRALGWPQFSLKVLKSDLDRYMKSDEDLAKLDANIRIQEEKIWYIEQVLKEIMSRQWTVRNAIEWRRFISGG